MPDLEKMKRLAQIAKLEASILDGKVRIEERKQDIARIEETIEAQVESINKLKSDKGEQL